MIVSPPEVMVTVLSRIISPWKVRSVIFPSLWTPLAPPRTPTFRFPVFSVTAKVPPAVLFDPSTVRVLPLPMELV
ncbi:MAG: hypothetical protein BWX80_03607 [Candidatus Hydrogenedentes bacterium ADurb.Bin101]|nr:MAG: hypothetical protein BWX80_03607 [Candidatus Hydrogenedentes bacterium ADurb.Bin101]